MLVSPELTAKELRRARRLQAVGRELRRLGVVAASRAADVTQRVTGLRVVF